MMTTTKLSPLQAMERITEGAVLIDIREAGERRRLHIPGSLHHPLSQGVALPEAVSQAIFHCASGARTQTNASTFSASTVGQSFVLDGGINAWKDAGLPVLHDRSQPIDIMRQVMIAAGSLVLLGVIMGVWINPLFYGLAGFVGAGLVFAGATGLCAMAKLLALAPWNKPETV